MIYKIFQFPDNPTYDYQYKNGNWYKRKKGSKDDFYVVDKDGQKKLNEYFNKKGFLFSYSTGVKVISGLSLLIIAYSIYKQVKRKK